MKRSLIAVVAGAVLLLGGCGIPDNTDVVTLRPGPSTGIAAGDDSSPERTTRGETTDKAAFIRNYLEAAAGDHAGAVDRVKEFLSPDFQVKYNPSAEIRVVRLTDAPLVEPNRDEVKVRLRTVGTLDQRGVLQPSPDGTETQESITVRTFDGQQGLFVTKAPNDLLISDDALERFYTQRAIYFWNQDKTGLVPDLRYMPRSVPEEQQPTVVMDWLINGPAPWLDGVADGLPDETRLIGNVPAVSNDTLQINLSDQAVPADDEFALDRLQKQLRWSLRPDLPATLLLNVEHQGQHQYSGTDYVPQNPAYRQVAEPERFVVFNGRIHRLARSYQANQPVPVIAPDANRGVRMAALANSGDRWYAALVVAETNGREALRVGVAGPGEHATLRRISLPAPIGRPVWATSPVGADPGTTGLVSANNKLYSFTADGRSVREVQWPDRPDRITAVAVAPDAHRVAVLAGGQLHVAAISVNDDGTQLLAPHVVHTELRSLSAVDWVGENLLVVAGVRPDSERVAMMDVSVDGAIQTDRLSDLGSNPVTYLATLPADPSRPEVPSSVAYVLGGGAYDEVNPDPLNARDLADPVADPPAGVLPSAPFFLN